MNAERQTLMKINNISGAWKYINSKRRNKSAEPPVPEATQLQRHFKLLLEGVDEVQETPPPREPGHIVPFDKNELIQQLRKMKRGKAAGPDELGM